MDFKRLYYTLGDGSPEDMYAETGCYYHCTYLVSSEETAGDE